MAFYGVTKGQLQSEDRKWKEMCLKEVVSKTRLHGSVVVKVHWADLAEAPKLPAGPCKNCSPYSALSKQIASLWSNERNILEKSIEENHYQCSWHPKTLGACSNSRHKTKAEAITNEKQHVLIPIPFQKLEFEFLRSNF